MAESKIIYCPKCQRRVAVWDGRATVDIIASCRKCRKRVIYEIKTKKTTIKNAPLRDQSSGMSFL